MSSASFKAKKVTSVLILTLVLAPSVYSQSAGLTKLRSPQPATIAGYIRGHCVALDQHTRICKMLSENKDTFLLEREGKPVGTWPGKSYLGETSDFEVLRGDLDSDRRPELIVANHDSTSAGMGVNWWTIFIFPDAEFRNFDQPLSFGVEEYGAAGTFVLADRGVNILTTSWIWRKGEGKRGNGLYLVGQWWRYKNGELHHLERPTVARRYLLSFERERLRTMDSAQIPYKWFTHPNVERLGVDPWLEIKMQAETHGIIEKVSLENVDSKRSIKLSFKTDSTTSRTFVYATDKIGPEELQLMFIGDAATRRIYPEGYLPALPEAWLKGRRGTLKHYSNGNPEGEAFEILWLEPRL